MASEVFNLAILLTLKDAASGSLDTVGAKMNSTAQKINKDLQSIEKEAKSKTQAIAKEIGKKTSEIEKFGGKLSNVEKLRNAGLESAVKQSSSIVKNIKQEADAVEDLGRKYQKSGKTDAAKQAAVLSQSLRDESKGIEQIGTKLKSIQKLREKGTDEAKREAKVLEQEVKEEIKNLDRLSSKYREIKSLKADNLEIKVKGDNLRREMTTMEAFERRYESLRQNLNRDLAIGGVGVAGLMHLKKGVDEAGNYESAMLDLKYAYQEIGSAGSRSAEQQKQDLKELSALATRLGSDLMGSTQDYVGILTAMKKAGVDVETVLGGAGEAAAYLANVNKSITNGTAPEMAKELGQYGKMFELKKDEFKSSVNLFSALQDRFDVNSSELVEGSKYFAATAKTAMDLRGLEGASEVAKLIAFSKRYTGYEGSRSGTNLDAIITQFVQHPKAVQALEQKSGIKLDFFDDKGKFKGDTADQRVETLFKEMEKLRALNPKDRLQALNDVFGQEGGRVAGQMVEQGLEGWRKINEEIAKAVPVQEKINEQMTTYNAKTEALSGSWINFKATAFTPLMESTKTFLDQANSIVGTMQKFSAENPGLTGTLTTIAAYGTTALVVYSAFKTLTTGFKLFRLASAFSRSEGLIPYLNSTATAANSATTAMATATTRATGLRGAIQRIGANSTVRIGVQIAAIMGIEYAISKAIESYMAAKESQKGAVEATNTNYKTFQNAEKDGTKFTKRDFDGQASATWFSVMNAGLRTSIQSEVNKLNAYETTKHLAMGTVFSPWNLNKFQGSFFDKPTGNTQAYAKGFKETAPQLADSRIMSAFLRQLDTRIPNKEEQKPVREALQQAFPESFAAAIKEISGISFTPLTQGMLEFSNQVNTQKQNYDLLNPSMTIFGQSLTDLQNPMSQTNSNITDLGTSSGKTVTPLNNVAISANNAASGLNSLTAKIDNWQPPTPQIQWNMNAPSGAPSGATTNSTGKTPSLLDVGRGYATGGKVRSKGLAYIHADEEIIPASVSRIYNDGVKGFTNSIFTNREKSSSTDNTTFNFARNTERSFSQIPSPQKSSQVSVSPGAKTLPSVILPNRDRVVGGNNSRIDIDDVRSSISSAASQNVSVNYSPQITFQGGNADEKTKENFKSMLSDHTKQIERIIAKRMNNGRIRA